MRTKRDSVLLTVGVVLFVFGIGIEAGAFGFPPHLRVYCNITNSNVVLLETNAEYLVPLSTIETYTRNLTSGNRTISIAAYYQNQLVLNQSYGNIGLGYDLIRTAGIAKALPIGSNLSIVVQLISSREVLSKTMSSINPNPGLLWPFLGVMTMVSGIIFMSPSGKRARMHRRADKKGARG